MTSPLRPFAKAVIICSALLFMAASCPALVINEIMFNPNGTDTGREWVEMYNEQAQPVNLSGYQFRENGGTHQLDLANGSWMLLPDKYAIIAVDSDVFSQEYLGFSGTLLDSAWQSLSNTGEEIAILDPNDAVLDSVNFTAEAAEGYTIERRNPYASSNLSANWAQSVQPGGSPGAQNGSGSQVPSIGGVALVILFAATLFVVIRKRS